MLLFPSCRCDVCVNAPPEMVNLKAEADAFMRVVAAHYVSVSDISFVCFCICRSLVLLLFLVLASFFHIGSWNFFLYQDKSELVNIGQAD